MLAKVICALPKWMGGGHKRGKRVGEATDIVTGKLNFYCPRCKNRWSRKERKAPKLKAVA